MKHLHLTINGMSCDHCVRAVRHSLTPIPGVTLHAVEVGSVDAEVLDGTAFSDMVLALEEEGYQVVEPTAF